MPAASLRFVRQVFVWFSVGWALSGCATTGPAINRTEYEAAQSSLRIKALQFRYRQTVRVLTVGMRVLNALSADSRVTPSAYVGVIVAPLDWEVGRAFGLLGEVIGGRNKGRQAVVVTGVVPGSPADQAGFKPGDLLLRVAGRAVWTAADAVSAFRHLVPNTTVAVVVERDRLPTTLTVSVGAKPYPVTFRVVADGEEAEVWNAWASPGQITVTSRLLEFMRSDDELAVVIGHELAHLTQGHLAKGMGTSLLGSVLGTVIEVATGVEVLGNVTGGIVQTAFSRDFEREADYIGLRYTHRAGYDIAVAPGLWERVATELPSRAAIPWLSTHPSDPERMVRLQKTVAEIKAQDATIPPASSGVPAQRPPDRG